MARVNPRLTIDLTHGRTVVTVREAGPEAPVAVVLPAMGVAAGYYTPFAEALVAQGISVAVPDYPGHGESTPGVSRRTRYGYRDLADEWLTAVIDAVVADHPEREVVLVAHSLGGHVALAHLAQHAHPAIRGLVTLGTASPYWRTYTKPLLLLAQTQTVNVVSRVLGVWPGHRMGFGGRQPRELMSEWARFAWHGRLEPQGSGAYEAAMGSISVPALVIDLANDTLAPPSAVDHFAGKLSGASVQRLHFDKGPDAPGRPVDHFSFARSPELIDEIVADFVLACGQDDLPEAAGAQTS